MSKSLNRVELIGNLTDDPVMKYTPDGTAVVTVSLATNETWYDKQANEKRERADFHRLVIFGKLAEIIEKYCNKGSKIFATGKLQTRSWDDDSGKKRYMTEVNVREIILLGGKRDEFSESVAQNVGAAEEPPEDYPSNEKDISDDIPF